MPRLTPVHWRRLEKVFLSIGFVFVRQQGSHRAYSRDGTPRPVVIPAYDEVPVAGMKSNLKTAGLSREEYLRRLETLA